MSAAGDEKPEPCPHRPRFNAVGRTLSAALPDFLASVGLLEKADLVIVVSSRVCGCNVVVADSPEEARAAAGHLLATAAAAEARQATTGTIDNPTVIEGRRK